MRFRNCLIGGNQPDRISILNIELKMSGTTSLYYLPVPTPCFGVFPRDSCPARAARSDTVSCSAMSSRRVSRAQLLIISRSWKNDTTPGKRVCVAGVHYVHLVLANTVFLSSIITPGLDVGSLSTYGEPRGENLAVNGATRGAFGEICKLVLLVVDAASRNAGLVLRLKTDLPIAYDLPSTTRTVNRIGIGCWVGLEKSSWSR